ncbi:PaRep2b protein [Pyrobaculum sp.]|uniref:PaRep2b protein n=1 Tax=Pyrobaculum sp. TaxID=2004705 RepID=UPI00316E5097
MRKAARDVERYGRRVVKPEHAAVAWALLEAGLKELGDARDKASALREAAKKLSRGEEAEIPAKELSGFVEKARDAVRRLELLFKQIAENAEKRGEEEVRRAFSVTEAAEDLAAASKADLGGLGDATLADKVVAFFEGLAEGATWSRVVLNALERGEAYGALIRAPKTAYNKYGAGGREKKGAKGEEEQAHSTASSEHGAGKERAGGDAERWETLLARLAYWLGERGVEKAVARRGRSEGGAVKDAVEIVVDDAVVAEVEARAVKEEGKVVFSVRGEWAREEGEKAAGLANEVEPGGAEGFELRALLATDGGYKADSKVYATTTSPLQAALYRRFGMGVEYGGMGYLTEEGFKPLLAASLSKEKGGAEVVEAIKRDLEEGLETLLDDAELRKELKAKALRLLGEIDISIRGVDKSTEEGRRKAEEARRRIEERIVKFLSELRLGEDGAVCLVDCKFGEPALTYRHEPYARVVAPLVHYIASDAPEEEVAKFLAYAILFDGHVRTGEVYLALGNFRVDDDRKRLPLDMYDKIALYVVLAAKYGVGVRRVYVREGEARLYLDLKYAARAFVAAWGRLSALLRWGGEQGLRDHVFKKLEGVRRYVEDYADKIKIEYALQGNKATVVFRDERGDEVARINIRWDGKSLHAYFDGSKESAERLASILNALGADAEAKKYGGRWHVELTTGSIAAIRRAEWLEAVRSLVEALHASGVIDGGRKEELLRELAAGPNVVEIAGVEFSVWSEEAAGRPKSLVIKYQPSSTKAFEAAVEALREAGLVEGVHFTAKRPEGGERGHIYIKMPAGLWRLEELRRAGAGWADRALRRLEEIARARGFYDVLDEYLRPAREAETVDPEGLVVEVNRGVEAVIKNVKMEWEDDKPKVVVEYEVDGEAKSFFFTWGVANTGKIRASVWLDEEKATVLAVLANDESIRGRKGTATLTARHLFALARHKGIGWELLR